MLDGPQQVTAVIRRPADTEYPDLAATLQRRLTARVDRPVAVEVEYRDADRAGPRGSPSLASARWGR